MLDQGGRGGVVHPHAFFDERMTDRSDQVGLAHATGAKHDGVVGLCVNRAEFTGGSNS